MSEPPASPRNSEQDQELHRSLIRRDPDAPANLAIAYLQELIEWLQRRNPRIDAHLCGEAAEDAILSLIRNPNSYRPDVRSLRGYLQMSAQGDLINILNREDPHWNVVELPQNRGKYLEVDDRTSVEADEADENMAKQKAIVEREAMKLSEPERRVLELMRQGERRTSAYAEAYGVTHLSPEEQAQEIKQVKDRLKVRLKRAGKRDEQTS